MLENGQLYDHRALDKIIHNAGSGEFSTKIQDFIEEVNDKISTRTRDQIHIPENNMLKIRMKEALVDEIYSDIDNMLFLTVHNLEQVRMDVKLMTCMMIMELSERGESEHGRHNRRNTAANSMYG